MQHAPFDLSVVIVNRNTRGLLLACLRSLRETRGELAMQVIVVDNGSTDGSVEGVREEHPEAHLIVNPGNEGFAGANNQGLRVATGRHVLLLNSDTEVREGALQRLVDFMEERPEVGACAPALFFPDGRPQPSCKSFPTPWRLLTAALLLERLAPRSRLFSDQERWFDHRSTRPVEQPMGAALLIRKSLLDRIGLLDEELRIHYNDVDLCLRIHQAGHPIYFVHDAAVMHHLGVTTRVENVNYALFEEIVRNAMTFQRKHYGPLGLAWYRACAVIAWMVRWPLFAWVLRVRPAPDLRLRWAYLRWHSRIALTGRIVPFARAPQ